MVTLRYVTSKLSYRSDNDRIERVGRDQIPLNRKFYILQIEFLLTILEATCVALLSMGSSVITVNARVLEFSRCFHTSADLAAIVKTTDFPPSLITASQIGRQTRQTHGWRIRCRSQPVPNEREDEDRFRSPASAITGHGFA